MLEQFSRTELLIGKSAIEKLQNSHVAVFGIGGVGAYAAEALVRSGIGAIDLIDSDTVAVSNINRQLIATNSTIGKYKTELMKERVLDINSDVCVNIHTKFFLPDNSSEFPFEKYDYIVDAIDTVKAKLELVEIANKFKIPIVSAMGAGNKLDPTKFEVTDIYKTSVCPLARVMRTELKKRKIKKLKVVYSKEPPIKQNFEQIKENRTKHPVPASIAFCPSVVGLIMASVVVRDLIKE